MKILDSVFDKPQTRALIDRWNLILEELGYENVDVAGNVSNMANSGKFVYIQDMNFMTLISNKYQYVMDNARAYYNTIEAIYSRQIFEEDWHKKVFYLRLMGKSSWDISKILNVSQPTVLNILNKYMSPQLRKVNAKATVKWVLDEGRWDDPIDKMLLSGFLADRPIEKTAKDVNIHVETAIRRLMSYINKPEFLSDRALLRIKFKGQDIPLWLRKFIDGYTQEAIAIISGISQQAVCKRIKQQIKQVKELT